MVLGGEVAGRFRENARGHEDGDIGAVFGAGGAVERLEVAAANRAVLGVALALDDDLAAVGQETGDVGP